MPKNDVSLIITIQTREYGLEICDKAQRHGGKQSISIGDIELKFKLKGGLLLKNIRKLTIEEINKLEHIVLTSPYPWNPEDINDNDSSAYDIWI